MPHQFQAILLKKIKYGDKDLILQTFSRQDGPKSFYVHGNAIGRKSGRVVLEPLSLLEIVAEKGKGDLWRARELKNDRVFYRLLDNVYKSSIILFINEVLVKSTHTSSPEPELYDDLTEFLHYLDEAAMHFENAHMVFLSCLTSHLGFQPNGRFSAETPVFNLMDGSFVSQEPEHRHFITGITARQFDQLQRIDYTTAESLSFSNAERRQLLGVFLDYFKIHVDRFDDVKSREVLEDVFQL